MDMEAIVYNFIIIIFNYKYTKTYNLHNNKSD